MRASFPAVVFAFVASAAFAQTPSESNAPKRTRLQVGASFGSTTMTGDGAKDSLSPSLVWRWRGKYSRADDRWGFSYRLSTLSTQISGPVGATQLPVADLKMRALLVGLEYKMPRGRWNWAAGMSGGWAFNSVKTPGEYVARAQSAVGAGDLTTDVHNTLAWGPRLKGWYDVNRRVSLLVESSYLVIRPTLDTYAFGAGSSRKLKGDAFVVKAGIVYGVF